MELLLVLTILAILAGIVLPRMAGRGEEARISASRRKSRPLAPPWARLKSITAIIPRGRMACRRSWSKPRDAMNWHGPYLEKDIPLDPWGKPYIYECPGNHNPTGYDLYATGPGRHCLWKLDGQIKVKATVSAAPSP